MTQITFAATQMACEWDAAGNIQRAEQLVREAAASGAQVILLQELFETPYFCKDQKGDYFSLARNSVENPLLQHFQALAAELEVV
jgi:N-carbamoylputrescine amidase